MTNNLLNYKETYEYLGVTYLHLVSLVDPDSVHHSKLLVPIKKVKGNKVINPGDKWSEEQLYQYKMWPLKLITAEKVSDILKVSVLELSELYKLGVLPDPVKRASTFNEWLWRDDDIYIHNYSRHQRPFQPTTTEDPS